MKSSSNRARALEETVSLKELKKQEQGDVIVKMTRKQAENLQVVEKV